MGKLTLTLHKTKDTKNKVVYDTKDGSVIQSVYIDKEALGDTPPGTVQFINSHKTKRDAPYSGDAGPAILSLGE